MKCREIFLLNATKNWYIILYDLVSRFDILRHVDPFVRMPHICEFVKEDKYLGVMIHSSMKTTIDVARQTRKFYLQANLLLRNFRHCSDQVKCVLFQTYCTNLYCFQLWFNSTKSSLKKLSTSYNLLIL